jgi:hypothetical protein
MARPPEEPSASPSPSAPADEAFAAFADLARWWPREYTWAGDTLEDIGTDPREDGFCFERGPTPSPATATPPTPTATPSPPRGLAPHRRPLRRQPALTSTVVSSTNSSRAWRNGRRAGFRSRWGNPWGFESPRSHTPLTRGFALHLLKLVVGQGPA